MDDIIESVCVYQHTRCNVSGQKVNYFLLISVIADVGGYIAVYYVCVIVHNIVVYVHQLVWTYMQITKRTPECDLRKQIDYSHNLIRGNVYL